MAFLLDEALVETGRASDFDVGFFRPLSKRLRYERRVFGLRATPPAASISETWVSVYPRSSTNSAICTRSCPTASIFETSRVAGGAALRVRFKASIASGRTMAADVRCLVTSRTHSAMRQAAEGRGRAALPGEQRPHLGRHLQHGVAAAGRLEAARCS